MEKEKHKKEIKISNFFLMNFLLGIFASSLTVTPARGSTRRQRKAKTEETLNKQRNAAVPKTQHPRKEKGGNGSAFTTHPLLLASPWRLLILPPNPRKGAILLPFHAFLVPLIRSVWLSLKIWSVIACGSFISFISWLLPLLGSVLSWWGGWVSLSGVWIWLICQFLVSWCDFCVRRVSPPFQRWLLSRKFFAFLSGNL